MFRKIKEANITHECKHKNFSQQKLVNGIQQYIKIIVHHEKKGNLIPRTQGYFNIQNSIYVIHHIHSLKRKLYDKLHKYRRSFYQSYSVISWMRYVIIACISPINNDIEPIFTCLVAILDIFVTCPILINFFLLI